MVAGMLSLAPTLPERTQLMIMLPQFMLPLSLAKQQEKEGEKNRILQSKKEKKDKHTALAKVPERDEAAFVGFASAHSSRLATIGWQTTRHEDC